jgi:hypothetical protein
MKPIGCKYMRNCSVSQILFCIFLKVRNKVGILRLDVRTGLKKIYHSNRASDHIRRSAAIFGYGVFASCDLAWKEVPSITSSAKLLIAIA